MSYSQLNQDNNVLEFFNHKKNLYFLDIGANDGISFSNTYKLEKEYNWKGICSEPLPRLYNDLKKCRNVKIDTNAVYSKSGLTLDFTDADSHMFSGITDCISKHKDFIGNNKKNIKVKTITLDKLLKKYKSPKIIHYMSLDTEGSEYEILKSVNYKNNKFIYINLEHNYEEPKRTEIRKLLEKNGYLYKGENQFDDDYIHYSTITGTYYFNNDYTRPIKIMRKGKNKFIVSSDYWENDNGEFKEGTLQFKNLNLKGNIFYNRIEFSDNNHWHKKTDKKNLLFIGANDMNEIDNYKNDYKNGLFIEPIPDVYNKLKEYLNNCNKNHNTNFKAIKKLVTDKEGTNYDFKVFSNNGASSSIYNKDKDWAWNGIDVNKVIKIKSTTIKNILIKEKWENTIFDVVLDVQGAELKVLRGFSKKFLNNISKLTVEISKKKYYKGGVLFKTLNKFLVDNGFKIESEPIHDHQDVVYHKINT